MKLSIDLTPEQLAQLRQAMAPTPAEIDAIALALMARMNAEAVAASASMTVAEFAKHARLSPNHVRRLIRAGKVEAMRPAGGGDQRITAAAAAKYFAGGGHGNGA